MPQDLIVAKFIGDNHVATCNTSDGSKPRWFFGHSSTIRGGQDGVPLSTSSWREGIGLQIVISGIDKSNRGEYCCRLSDGKRPHGERCFELTVKEPIRFLDTPELQEAQEYTDCAIKCEVTGDPTPEIQWRFKGQPVRGKRFRKIGDGLSIRNVSVSDRGVYECVAIQMSEQVTSQQTRNISLRVLHAPKFKFPETSKSPVYGYIHGEVNLTCAVTADPPANITWYPSKSDSPHGPQPLTAGVLSMENKSILRVKLNDISVFGKYKCVARNKFNNVTKEILLQQGFKPKPPHHVEVAKVSSTTAILEVATPVVGPKVQQSTHKSGSNSSGGGGNSSKSGNVNDTLGYRVRLTRVTNGTDYTVEQECEPAPCRLHNLTPNTNYTMLIATKGKAGLSDWVGGPLLLTASGASAALCSGAAVLAAVSAVVLASL
ncbi:hypothetical protein ONE63_004603 [Megalurothrips usitatus]|uniref:Ig-like domain-containing protein n=1 Tax=Megalurothrips usitatus TaxID=439358 RepID=A0AAV7X3I1_9NEOP|nr:hypothetical protein ONE63_004603 [Megalurothrips usitatus]